MGDGARLRQALLNLLGNALKFTASGEVSLQVTSTQGGDRVHVSVSDTGIGIPEAAKAHLFAPFTQADSSTTRRFGGTGLGLAITKSIVELMSGEIDVESREGGGSTFWFTALLPAAPDQPVSESRRLPDARILILEGPRSGQSILQRHLKSWGLRSVTVASVPETLAALRAEHFDAALIDMQIPGVDAAGLLREIAADSSLNSTPILRLTPIGGIPQGNAATPVHKPVKPAILFDALQRILQPSSCPQAADPPRPFRALFPPAGAAF